MQKSPGLNPYVLRFQHRIEKVIDGIDRLGRHLTMTEGAMLRSHHMLQVARWEWLRTAIRYIDTPTLYEWEQKRLDLRLIMTIVEARIGSATEANQSNVNDIIMAASNDPLPDDLEAALALLDGNIRHEAITDVPLQVLADRLIDTPRPVDASVPTPQ